MNYGLKLSEFEVGQTILHEPGKTIFESDNNLFCLLTMNHHPVHLDVEFCNAHSHGKILVVGPLIFSLVVGMTVSTVSGKAIANLEYENIKHLKPVSVNDTIHARTQILDVTISPNGNTGVLYVETHGYNQHGEDVISFRRRVLFKNE